MGAFETPVAWIGTICGGIAALAIFFTLLGAVNRGFSRFQNLEGAFIGKGARISAHFVDGRNPADGTFIGFTPCDHKTAVIPHQLLGMLIVEDERGRRVLIRSDRIRVIEEIQPPPGRKSA